MAAGNERNFELKIGRTGIIIVITGMTALLCASFLFGIDVGKNIDTYPGKITSMPQRALALVWRPAKMQIAQGVPEENINLNYHDALTSKKGLSNMEPTMEKQPSATPVQNEEEAQKGKFNIESNNQPVATDEKKAEKEEAQTIEEIITQEDIKKEKKETQASKEEKDNSKNKTGSRFIVQVAALKEKSKAGEIHKKISAMGYHTEIVKAEIKGKGTMFRVIASGFDDQAKAQKVAGAITQKTGTKCIVRKMDVNIKKN
ncbi:MAG: SPOR domain-containing protein [Smithella sp.]